MAKSKSKSKSKSSLKTASSCESARNQWSSLPWSKVQTDKTNNNDNDNNNDDHQFEKDESLSSFLQGSNHYDNPKANPSELYAADSRGLDYVEGANDPGIMLGLEVIDGSQYTVEKVAVRNEVTREQTGFVTRLVVGEDHHRDRDRDDRIEIAEEKVQVPPPAASDEDNSKVNDNDNVDVSSLSRKEKNKLKLEKLKAKRKEIKLKKKRKREQAEAEADKTSNSKDNSNSTSQSSSNPKQIKRKKSKDTNVNVNATQAPETVTVTVTETQMQTIRVSWSIATGGVYLHPRLCASLHRLGFVNPTPIQSSTLAASILGHRDVVGAAPTGSGKTLSYLLPILHKLLTECDDKKEQNQEEGHVANNQKKKEAPRASSSSYPLTALILCPTRELAMQVSMEFAKLMNHNHCQRQNQRQNQPHATDNDNVTNETDYSFIRCGTIVGGLSEQKQKRVLDVKRPPVLVGTPGRLWDLMSTNDHAHLNDLKQLRFIVIDEADRMISQGSFPQLERIFERIQQANPSLEYMAKHEEDYIYGEEEDEEDGRMLGLPGIRGEAKVQMLDDRLLAMIEKQERADRDGDSENDQDAGVESDDCDDNDDSDDVPPQPIEMDDDEYEAQQAKFEQDLEEMDHFNDDGDSDDEEEEEEMVKRQTFVFSATLTLPTSSHQNIAAQSKKKGKKNKKGGKVTVDGAIAEILEKVGAQGQTKVVDLSTNSKIEAVAHTPSSNKKSKDKPGPSAKPKVQLPPGLSLYEMRCTQKHKDSHLYSFLTNTKQGASGPSLVFCNSIGAVKRVGETLKVLGLPVRMLHAQMQQKSRLSSLESLNRSNARSIVVATDVAARGLDIPSVASVIHYDVARAVDTFVHRAGRTARGMGEKAVGWSISLVSAPEEKSHQAICRAVNGDVSSFFDTAPMDSRLLSIAQERVNLASKIVVCEEAETKTNKSNQWFIDAANDAGLDLDEDLLDEGQLGGSKKERQQFLEAKRARQELKILLSKPMRKQAFGKFLSNAGLREAIQAEKEVKPYIVDSIAARQGGKKKKKRKIKK